MLIQSIYFKLSLISDTKHNLSEYNEIRSLSSAEMSGIKEHQWQSLVARWHDIRIRDEDHASFFIWHVAEICK